MKKIIIFWFLCWITIPQVNALRYSLTDQDLTLNNLHLIEYSVVMDFSELSPKMGWPSDDEDKKITKDLEEGFSLDNVLDFEHLLNQKVIGQEDAVGATVRALLCYKAEIHDPKQPIATFLYIGGTGVGKTELAKQLGKIILTDQSSFIRLNMSEYAEPQTGIHRLIGLSKGYKDSEEGGQLSNAILAHPYSIILLDEIEKAHFTVRKFFLHLFDEGQFNAGTGELIDCRNCLFIATTNIASNSISMLYNGEKSSDVVLKAIQPELMRELSPELFNRLEPVLFRPISPDMLDHIIINLLRELFQRVLDKRQVRLDFDKSVHAYIKKNGYSYELGVRPVKRLISDKITSAVARALIAENYKRGDRMKINCEDSTLVIIKQ